MIAEEIAGILRQKSIWKKATKYNLQPVALGLFGDIYNYHRVPWPFGKFMPTVELQLIEAGTSQTEPRLCDTRNLNVICSCASDHDQTI